MSNGILDSTERFLDQWGIDEWNQTPEARARRQRALEEEQREWEELQRSHHQRKPWPYEAIHGARRTAGVRQPDDRFNPYNFPILDSGQGGVASLFTEQGQVPAARQQGMVPSKMQMGIEQLINQYKPTDYEKEMANMVSDKPYSNWDYVRDMSAKLLASKDPRFLGALGEASLYSNEKRDRVESANQELKAKLRMATLKSKEDADKVKTKSLIEYKLSELEALSKIPEFKAAKEGKRIIDEIVTDPNNGRQSRVKTTWYPVISGHDFVRSMSPDSWKQVGNTLYIREQDINFAERQKSSINNITNTYERANTRFSEGDTMKARLNGIAASISTDFFNIKDSPEYADFRTQIMEAGGELPGLFNEAVQNEDIEAIDALSRAMMNYGPAFSQYGNLMAKGHVADLEDHEIQGQLLPAVKKETLRLIQKAAERTPYAYLDEDSFIDAAMRNVLMNADWELKGASRFDLEATSQGQEKAESLLTQITGTDSFGDLFNMSIINMQEYPGSHPKSGDEIMPKVFNKPNEINILNKSQWDLLPDYTKQEVANNMNVMATRIGRETGFDENRIFDDIANSIIENNSIYGGDDRLFWDNKSSKFFHPDEWYVEPQEVGIPNTDKKRPTSELRDQGYAWNGFKGEWFTYENGSYKAYRPKRKLKKIPWPSTGPRGYETNLSR